MKRNPDFIIGPKDAPYLRRWWVIPRNRFFNIYLHHILSDDDDSALHDHPWANVSIVLRGFYIEHTADKRPARRSAGSVTFRRAKLAHRLALGDKGRPCWTLFITGPVTREWGFHCPKGWVPWKEFVDNDDAGITGKGCGEE